MDFISLKKDSLQVKTKKLERYPSPNLRTSVNLDTMLKIIQLFFIVICFALSTQSFAKDQKVEDYKKPTQDELKKKLTPEQYSCTQEEGTETPFHNKYWNN